MSIASASYEWDAAKYSEQSQAQAVWADEVIARLALKPDDRVLDVGCGDGKLTARIAEHVPDGFVVGIDSSESMIALARARFGGLARRLEFNVMDASELRFSGEFDAVFSNAALHWIRDHRPVLRGIHAALRTDGRVRMQMGGRGNAAEVLAVVDEVRSRPEWAAYFAAFTFPYNFYGPEQYEVWLEEAGLVPERVELVSRPMRHTPEQFAGWLSTTWMPYTGRVPDEKRDRFVMEVVEVFVERFPPDAGGVLTVPMIRLNVDARKKQA